MIVIEVQRGIARPLLVRNAIEVVMADVGVVMWRGAAGLVLADYGGDLKSLGTRCMLAAWLANGAPCSVSVIIFNRVDSGG